jgi:hypothetical protein
MPLFLALALLQAAAPPGDSALRAALREARLPVRPTADGRLGGPGGALLAREVAAAQFLLVGEEHGVDAIPGVVAALLREAAPHGYRYFGIEVGWQVARELNRLALTPDVAAGVAAFGRAHPPGVPFFNLRQEAELLGDAVALLGGSPDVLWGLDYDIMADRWLLPRLRAAAPAPAARTAVDRAVAHADSLFARALATRNPGAVMMFGGTDSVFRALRLALTPAPGSEADHALWLMEETLAINRLWVTGRTLESNARRGRLMKRQLARALAAARPAGAPLPRAAFKFGASHMMRGLSFTGIYDVGTTLAELAALEGGDSFHLWVLGGPGSRRAQVDPTVFRYGPVTGELDRTPALAALRAEAPADGWTLFDLRPLRPRARQLLNDPALVRIVFGFDAVLVLGGSGPATPLGEP